VTDFTSLLRRWTGRATSRKPETEKETQIVKDHPEQVENKTGDHRHGAEGHAFQVNDEPEQVDDRAEDHRHGAEGHAFQVNDEREQVEDKAEESL